MLDLGFLPDIEKLMKMLPEQRQTMLFSATMPGPIVALARGFMNQPIQIRAEQATERPRTDHIEQFVYRAHALDKVEVLARVLQARGRGLTMIFTRTKRTAAKVADDLAERGFAAAAVHGDLGQGAREQALRAFRSGKVDVLVATDVAARGLDVEGITHVINYQAPEDEMTYVHRIGRTARAGATGKAITLVDWDDVPRWKLICDKLDLPFHEPVETYSTSPHLLLELDIPAEAGSRLPKSEQTRAGLGAEEIEDLGGRAPRPARGGSGGGAGRGSGSGGSSSSGSGNGGRRRSRGSRGSAEGGASDRPRTDRSATNASTRTGSGSADGESAGDRPAPRTRNRKRTRRGGSAGGSGAGSEA
jgi:superfamily II DNA/RNA helicase